MKLAQILEARYYGNPIINFIQKVEIGTDDYTQFPRDEIPQVADAITRVYGQPKHEPRRTDFGGDAWREWYWEVDNPESYLNIYITIPKRAKGERRVARLGVENYEYENDPDEHGYMDEAVAAGEHPIFQEIEKTTDLGYRDFDIDAEDTNHVIRALTTKFGEPHISPAESLHDGDTVTAWTWGDHAYEGTDFEISVFFDAIDNTAWIEVRRWPEMHPGDAEGLNEAKYYRDHPVIQWIKDTMEFLRVNQLLTVHVKDADEAIKAIGFEYGPPLAIGSDYSEWNVETDVHGGRLYHLEVRDKAQGGSVNLTRVI